MVFGRHLKRCLFNLDGSMRGQEFLRTLSEVTSTYLNAHLTSPSLLSSRVLQRSTFTAFTAVQVSIFPRFGTGYMFSRAVHWLHVFPRFDTGYMFSRAWRRLHVFLRLASVTSFPALDTVLHVFRI